MRRSGPPCGARSRPEIRRHSWPACWRAWRRRAARPGMACWRAGPGRASPRPRSSRSSRATWSGGPRPRPRANEGEPGPGVGARRHATGLGSRHVGPALGEDDHGLGDGPPPVRLAAGSDGLRRRAATDAGAAGALPRPCGPVPAPYGEDRRRREEAMTVMTAMVVLAAQQPPLRVTLAEAVRRALEVQPAVIQARGDVRNASAGERAAWGAFLPTITTSSSAARSNVGRIDQVTGRAVPPQYTYTVGLSASLDLFNGFRREANQRAAAATSDAADAGFVTKRYETILNPAVVLQRAGRRGLGARCRRAAQAGAAAAPGGDGQAPRRLRHALRLAARGSGCGERTPLAAPGAGEPRHRSGRSGSPDRRRGRGAGRAGHCARPAPRHHRIAGGGPRPRAPGPAGGCAGQSRPRANLGEPVPVLAHTQPLLQRQPAGTGLAVQQLLELPRDVLLALRAVVDAVQRLHARGEPGGRVGGPRCRRGARGGPAAADERPGDATGRRPHHRRHADGHLTRERGRRERGPAGAAAALPRWRRNDPRPAHLRSQPDAGRGES